MIDLAGVMSVPATKARAKLPELIAASAAIRPAAREALRAGSR